MLSLLQIQQPVRDELREFEQYFRRQMRSDIPLLSIILNYILRHKGKQIRPLFVLLSSRLCGDITQTTYTAATLIELLHTATLIHDDVVDNSFRRRGVFSIHALWHSKIAVLAGDYLLAKGLLIALETHEYDLLTQVSSAVKEMSEGELLQQKISGTNNLSEQKYFEIITKKTASLIAACTACGALSAKAATDDVERMYRFGQYAGIAFQIKDDLLDFTGTTLTGKPKGTDLKDKKITLPLIHALHNGNPRQANKILQAINNRDSHHYSTIVDFVVSGGGIDYALKQMIYYKEKALTELEKFTDKSSKEALIQLLDFVINRKH